MISPLLTTLILVNTIFLFVLLIKSLYENVNSKYDKVLRVDLAILGIAFTQYAMTFIIEQSDVLQKDAKEFAQQLRYVDWLITTPLLLYSYWKLAQIEGWNGDFVWLLFADLVMMIFGIAAEFFTFSFKTKMILYTIGCLGYVYIFIEILRIMNFFNNQGDNVSKSKANLGYFFLIGWLIYPIGFFLTFESKFVLYSFGDFINKGLYSIALQNTFK
jgi:sensory rhodopsin